MNEPRTRGWRGATPLIARVVGWSVAASLGLSAAAILAGLVRLLPWLIHPDVPWSQARVFAEGLLALALEAALFVGIPLGSCLAAASFVRRGEARALETLGASPWTTMRGVVPVLAGLSGVLVGISLRSGNDAAKPGALATELVHRAKQACARAETPKAIPIPFTELAWLCFPRTEVQEGAQWLTGRAPGGLRATFVARGANIDGDFRRIQLTEATVMIPTTPNTLAKMDRLVLSGLAPFAHASGIPVIARTLSLALSACLGSAAGVFANLRARRRVVARSLALVHGLAVPLCVLGLLRALERAHGNPLWLGALPLASLVAIWASTFTFLRAGPILRRRAGAATTPG